MKVEFLVGNTSGLKKLPLGVLSGKQGSQEPGPGAQPTPKQ